MKVIGRRFLRLIDREKSLQMMKRSLYFDPLWYRGKYNLSASQDPAAHFLDEGCRLGLNPSPLFDVDWYLKTQSDVQNAGINPFIHFITHGDRELRSPHPLFDSAWYIRRYSTPNRPITTPFLDFITYAREKNRSPIFLFDVAWYLKTYDDVAGNPLVHYLEKGVALGHDPSPLFDSYWYVRQYSHCHSTQISIGCPLLHYVLEGEKLGYIPFPLFDTDWYRFKNPDITNSVNLFRHFVEVGFDEGRSTHPLFDADWYQSFYGVEFQEGGSSFKHYLRNPNKQKPNLFFDPVWYTKRYPDAIRKGRNPLSHYLAEGAELGYNPSSEFHAAWYLKANEDVAQKNINPLVHFLQYGRSEGRQTRKQNKRKLLKEMLDRKQLVRPEDIISENDPEVFFRAKTKALFAEVHTVLSEAKHSADFRVLSSGEFPRSGEVSSSDRRKLDLLMSRPNAYVATLDNFGMIAGSATLLSPNGLLMNDELAHFDSALEPKNPNVSWLSRREALIRFSRRAIPAIKSGIHLTKEYDGNFFHWTVEILPRLFVLEEIGLSVEVPALVTGGHHSNLYDLLQLVADAGRRVIRLEPNHFYKVEKLVYPGDQSCILDFYNEPPGIYSTSIPVDTMRRMRGRVLENLGQNLSKPFRKIYVRRSSNYRSLVNQDQIERFLTRMGFEVIDNVDRLSIPEQIVLFSESSVIVAATGASLTNILWCQPATKIVILNSDHPFTNTTFWNELGKVSYSNVVYVTGQRAHVVEGRYAVHDDFSIGLKDLEICL